MREKADKYWCTRALRSKTVCERVYVITCLLTATYTKQNIANGLVKKLLAIQSNLKQFCLLVIPLGFEPKTHSLEGCCSNPTELRDLQIVCKGTNKILTLQIFMSFLLKKNDTNHSSPCNTGSDIWYFTASMRINTINKKAIITDIVMSQPNSTSPQ